MASIFAFRHPEVLRNTSVHKKYKHINAGEHTLQDCEEKLEKFMAGTKPYLSQSCTLPRVAQNIDTPAYLVSHVINERHNKNFPDYINELRIEKAKELLINPEYKQYKIAFIARECGFNSLSAFNAAFKKFTGLTPSRYKERLPDL
jgi:AraC-like DNA-binding protein